MIASFTSVELNLAPIEASWIREGQPSARNATLSRSADGLASTMIWDCTAGKFEWIYDIDETIYFLEGSATISDGHHPPKTFGPGEVLFLPRGAVCHWHVETYVKKVAFCRRTQPRALGFAMRVVSRLARLVKRPRAGGASASQFGFELA